MTDYSRVLVIRYVDVFVMVLILLRALHDHLARHDDDDNVIPLG